MDTLDIRNATPEDVPFIRQLIRELAEYENMQDQDHATCQRLHENLFVNHEAEAIIAECNGTPAGMAIFFHNFSTWLASPGIYLEDLFVRPQFRGKGLGRALLAKLAQIAVEKDFKRLDWACLDWNRPSIDFYLSLGAKPMADWTTYRLEGLALNKLAQTSR